MWSSNRGAIALKLGHHDAWQILLHHRLSLWRTIPRSIKWTRVCLVDASIPQGVTITFVGHLILVAGRLVQLPYSPFVPRLLVSFCAVPSILSFTRLALLLQAADGKWA